MDVKSVVTSTSDTILQSNEAMPDMRPCSPAQQLKLSKMGTSFHAKIGKSMKKDKYLYVHEREKRHRIGISRMHVHIHMCMPSTYIYVCAQGVKLICPKLFWMVILIRTNLLRRIE